MNIKFFVLSFFAGLLGAFSFELLRPLVIDSNPHAETRIPLTQSQELKSGNVEVLRTRRIDVVDANGKTMIQIGAAKQGPPGIWILDKAGVARGIFGLYEDDTSYMGLQDQRGEMIQLMRSFGANEAPLLIFKNHGLDKMIMGLNPANGTEPFTMTHSPDGQRKNIFGNYEGP